MGIDKHGNIFIADNQNNVIRKVNTAGIISTVAGTGAGGYSGDGGPATAAHLSAPGSIWIDNADNLYISDAYNFAIRKVSPSGTIITIAGNGSAGFSGDGGSATSATMQMPSDVRGDNMGNIYFTDFGNNRIRKINTTGIISTIAGTGSVGGFSGDGGFATLAQFNGPSALTFDYAGNLIVSDMNNNRIRKIGSTDHTPSYINGAAYSFTACKNAARPVDSMLAAIDSDAAQPLTWSILSAPAHGTVSGPYTTTSTGTTVLPTGLTYTPATGYTGSDGFTMRVTDGLTADTITMSVTVNPCPTAVEYIAYNNTPVIYPNPTIGGFTVNLPTTTSVQHATTYVADEAGRIVMSRTTDNQKTIAFDLNVSPGIYVIQIITQDGNWHEKLFINK